MTKTPVVAVTLLLAACSPQPAADPSPPVTTAAARADPPGPIPPPVANSASRNDASPVPTATPAADPRLAVDGDGLRWFMPGNGAARPLPFGQPQAAVLASLERVRGPAGRGANQDCGAGPVQYANWADGLSLVFQNGRFAGWGLDGRAAGALATAAGVGPGSTRAELADAYGVTVRPSTLGAEFSAGDIHGILDGPGPTAKITDMWAGVSCVAR